MIPRELLAALEAEAATVAQAGDALRLGVEAFDAVLTATDHLAAAVRADGPVDDLLEAVELRCTEMRESLAVMTAFASALTQGSARLRAAVASLRQPPHRPKPLRTH